jgi:hypothetical protein
MRQIVQFMTAAAVRGALAVVTLAGLAVPNASAQTDVVLQASSTSARVGKWQVYSDSAAFGGQKVRHPDAGAAKITTAAASPANDGGAGVRHPQFERRHAVGSPAGDGDLRREVTVFSAWSGRVRRRPHSGRCLVHFEAVVVFLRGSSAGLT